MHIAYTAEQEALRQELRAYFATLMTPEVEAEVAVGNTGGPHCLEAVRRMGRDGWLGIGWPKEYGGQGRTPIEQFLFFDEAMYAGIMVPTLTLNAVAPTSLAVIRTVVSGGFAYWASGMSSKPTMETSSGTRKPAACAACSAPIAVQSLEQTTAVGGLLERNSASIACWPPSAVCVPSRTSFGSALTPLARRPSRKACRRVRAECRSSGPVMNAMRL